MRIVILADTHAPRRWKSCPAAVAAILQGADRILHAGDVCTVDVLQEMAEFAPVTVVRGNNDRAEIDAPDTVELDLGGLQVAMIHDSGPARGRAARLHRRFPAADLVVFGHSHIPLDETAESVRIFNPGSPTDRRRQPYGTVGELTVRNGAIADLRLIRVT